MCSGRRVSALLRLRCSNTSGEAGAGEAGQRRGRTSGKRWRRWPPGKKRERRSKRIAQVAVCATPRRAVFRERTRAGGNKVCCKPQACVCVAQGVRRAADWRKLHACGAFFASGRRLARHVLRTCCVTRRSARVCATRRHRRSAARQALRAHCQQPARCAPPPRCASPCGCVLHRLAPGAGSQRRVAGHARHAAADTAADRACFVCNFAHPARRLALRRPTCAADLEPGVLLSPPPPRQTSPPASAPRVAQQPLLRPKRSARPSKTRPPQRCCPGQPAGA